MPSRKLVAAFLILALFAASGCGAKRKWDKGTTWGALSGVLVGGGAGVGVAAAVADDDRSSELARGGAIGAASGALIGGLVGHYLFDPPVELPTPIVVPPPAPVAEVIEPTVLEPIEEGELLAVVREATDRVSGFGFDSAAVPRGAIGALDSVASRLATSAPTNIVVEGHTDSIGAESYNYQLGRRRAQSVADYLVKVGVPVGRIRVTSAGETAPIASNSTDSGRRENRRVEVRAGSAVTTQRMDPDPSALEEVVPAEVVPAESVPAASSADHRIYFDDGVFSVAALAQPVLNEIAATLKADPTLTVEVVGHMDASESDAALSSLRAARIRLELINRGIEITRITTRGARSGEPIDRDPSLNRRVEINYR